MYVLIRREYILLWMFLTAIWKPQKQQALGAVTLLVKLLLRFLLTMPLEAAKNARTWEMKCGLVSDSLVQSARSVKRLLTIPHTPVKTILSMNCI